MLVSERPQLAEPRHLQRVLLADDFAQHTGRPQAGHDGKIGRRLGVARADQHTTIARTQRHHMTGPAEIIGPGLRIGQQPDRAGAVLRRDPSRIDILCVHRHRVGGARGSWFTRDIGGRSSRSASASVSGTQM